MATDPVCGMWVDEASASLKLVRDNRSYFFCSETCLRQFAAPEEEDRRLRSRLAVAWPLSIAIVVLTYVVRGSPEAYASAALATVVQVYAGGPFYRGLVDAARDRSWNMDVLIAVATSAAYAYSVGVLAVPGRLPPSLYFDASSLILALILTGNFLEHRTRARAGSALRRLEARLPSSTTVLREGREVTVPVTDVRSGDHLRVRPGERFAADGVVRAGRTTVDESILTGESMPVPKVPGDRVLAGSINGEGQVDEDATDVGLDTFVAQIGRLLTDAEMSRVPLQRSADRIAAIFVPVVLAIGLVAATLWWLVGGSGPTVALLVFVSVAITACPCAFGIATPAAILVGTGRAAEEGILFRGEDAIGQSARVDLVLTDKTGTLTLGRPRLVEIRSTDGRPEGELLGWAAAVERGSEHPLARAVLAAAQARGLAVPLAEDVTAAPGEGVRGVVDGHRVEVRRLLEEPAATDGRTRSVLVADGRPMGELAFEDPVAPGVPGAVRALRDDGVEVVMVTGDRPAAARAVAAAVGIATVRAGVSPAGKRETVAEFRRAGRHVAFVGDGINDAPALAAADVGIAIGSGTDVAREAGQIVLVRADFAAVPLALRLARRIVGKVRGNLAWAIGYNAVLLPIAAGALVPLFGFGVYGVLPIAGAAAMGISSTTVLANSLSLRRAGRVARPAGTVARATPAQ
jgi:P-type Cu+ transporter